MRLCPVRQTTMERNRCRCVNLDCRVSLKEHEKEVQGTDVLGTALVTPIHQYHHRVKETQYGFEIDIVNENVSECHDKFQHAASNHPDHQVQVLPSDPVFVNPAVDALKFYLE